MKRGLLLAALVVIAMIVAFAAQKPGSDAPEPSITNQGPRGLAVLKTWLEESGVEVVEQPTANGTLVIAAPSMREFTESEVNDITRFVEAGGTLVYLVPRNAPQPVLNHWLNVVGGPIAPLNSLDGIDDVGGSTVEVSMPIGPLQGLREFRVSAEKGVHLTATDAIEVADYGALWWRRIGKGQVWVGSGPDLAENARLELADNAKFWRRLPSPISFDEAHHQASLSSGPVNIAITMLQLLFLAGLFVWANGVRLGAARDPLPNNALSTMTYVRAMAALTRNAKVEAELVTQLKRDFRRFLFERLGIPTSLPWKDAATETARRLSLDLGEVLPLDDERELLAVSQRIANIERASTSAR